MRRYPEPTECVTAQLVISSRPRFGLTRMDHSWEKKAWTILAEQDASKRAALIERFAAGNQGTADALPKLIDALNEGKSGNKLWYELHCIMDNHPRFPGVAWSIHAKSFADHESAIEWAQHELEATGADRVRLYVTGIVSASGMITLTMNTEHKIKGNPVVELIKK